ncbi:MAG: mandelate racemase/muconate lactonizing enzyme family protein [Bryobacteraceae bacterium]|nr:mandelate racemase/muconate lactonizing enzyme family protein [Bryobacteraceae bacterium]
MKIVRVDAHLLSFPLPEPVELAYHGGHRRIVKRDALLIRVECASGLVGYAPGSATEAVRDVIANQIVPFLLGQTLVDPDALRIRFVSPSPLAAKAYAMVEVALLDALGKHRGLPVSELLGGRVRDHIRLYASAGMYQSPESYAEEAAGIQALGFTAYKMRPGLGPEADVRAVELMRRATGPSFDLMVDAHTWWRMGDHSYTEQTVHDVARQMAAYEIAWLEEPLLPDHHAAYARLRAAGLVPIASGEHEPDEAGFTDLIAQGGVDYVQLDLLCQGGYPAARRLFTEVARHGLRFAFHSWGTDLEIVTAAQLGVCWPEDVVEWLEYPVYTTPTTKSMYGFDLAREILRTPLDIENGELMLNRAPGLGVEVDESVITRYPWIPGPWSYFTLHSPAETFAVVGDHSVKFA